MSKIVREDGYKINIEVQSRVDQHTQFLFGLFKQDDVEKRRELVHRTTCREVMNCCYFDIWHNTTDKCNPDYSSPILVDRAKDTKIGLLMYRARLDNFSNNLDILNKLEDSMGIGETIFIVNEYLGETKLKVPLFSVIIELNDFWKSSTIFFNIFTLLIRDLSINSFKNEDIYNPKLLVSHLSDYTNVRNSTRRDEGLTIELILSNKEIFKDNPLTGLNDKFWLEGRDHNYSSEYVWKKEHISHLKCKDFFYTNGEYRASLGANIFYYVGLSNLFNNLIPNLKYHLKQSLPGSLLQLNIVPQIEWAERLIEVMK